MADFYSRMAKSEDVETCTRYVRHAETYKVSKELY